jgi:hypothetical protein
VGKRQSTKCKLQDEGVMRAERGGSGEAMGGKLQSTKYKLQDEGWKNDKAQNANYKMRA